MEIINDVFGILLVAAIIYTIARVIKEEWKE